MARTTITPFVPNIPYPVLPVVALSADLSMQALSGSSGANGNQAAFNGASLMLITFQNTAVGSQTVTITSLASSTVYNRTGDITAYAMAAGAISQFLIPANGYKQVDGFVYFEGNSASIKCSVQLFN